MKPQVFIHTNHKQIVGAIVAEYSLRRNSQHADQFDVRIIHTKDYPFLWAKEGQEYLRDGVTRQWHMEDLQSFTPLRFMPPELMGYEGRAVVIDPDVFAVGDVWELLSRDMGGAAIMCRPRSGSKEKRGVLATSVMLLDCAKLTHWKVEEQFNAMFEMQRDYAKWIGLGYEPRETIGLFENEWNDFDKLTPATRMLHNTKRKTQPWKTGLPVDFMPPEKPSGIPALGWLNQMRRRCSATTPSSATTSATPIPTRSGSSSACCASASTRDWSPRTCCARRCARTTCATTPSRCWSGRCRWPRDASGAGGRRLR